jgi:hypothetical protein
MNLDILSCIGQGNHCVAHLKVILIYKTGRVKVNQNPMVFGTFYLLLEYVEYLEHGFLVYTNKQFQQFEDFVNISLRCNPTEVDVRCLPFNLKHGILKLLLN